MKPNLEQLIHRSVIESNILPITSKCNVRCMFCSNKQNPPGVETFQTPPMDLNKIRDLLDCINPEKKIIIGESVTRIDEGEPMTHPYFQSVIKDIRERFSKTPIQITTNGIALQERLAEAMAEAGGIELNVSLNSSSPNQRSLLMGNTSRVNMGEKLNLLNRYHIPFNGSIVAMPHVTGWKDLAESIFYLEQKGALSTRVFLPSYTNIGLKELKFEESIWGEVHNFIRELRPQLGMPVSCEPPIINDLNAVVEGVFPGSAVANSGIKIGDFLLTINGRKVFSRVDAYNSLRRAAGRVKIGIKRWSGVEETTYLDKKADESPGVLMSYDIHPDLIRDISAIAEKKDYKRVLCLASELGSIPLRLGLEKFPSASEFTVVGVTNRFFGGNIKCAGLLVVQDFMQFLNREKDFSEKYDAVFIPQDPFDSWGRDLCGVHYLDMQSAIRIPLELL